MRRWVSRAWICCRLEFKGRHRNVWGAGYTELFFLDEPTALAAGHRPCFECRRKDARAFAAAFARGPGTRLNQARRARPARARHRPRAPCRAARGVTSVPIGSRSTVCPTAPFSPCRTSPATPSRSAVPRCCGGRPRATPPGNRVPAGITVLLRSHPARNAGRARERLPPALASERRRSSELPRSHI